tara:strand:- start:18 stop:374 length:357 start_codon:yes stop_codon:yes gene_type:complete
LKKNITVFYQKEFNPYGKYTKDFSKTHTKVYEGVINQDEDQDTVFNAFNHYDTNPLSVSNTSNKVCIVKDKLVTGQEFQEAMKNKKVECKHTSMSVGDIVAVDGTNYLCKDVGWEALS